ncbi:hypothetical protein TVAG_487170 [Trichomonas vaginalis G3]|uniref:DUF3447 domain-containing protein n=1 Tax=Trichomonas vaginalis (strain ATCC PRA-98 / G3) TaxID=412133 RepID=A2DZE5_TRIV3|nr:proteasome regulatory particle assembly [Trichomonas vaginalis G3]EAY14274.1 hypothetical protein TVAG_487170 [Trichomonas vaginalis G3]KAI5491865.1 proteasome regulatory particle assembly [Trichomonas vaginalis G3]|eukprot:XP_001326497.1 hypothetical protein [Trichomonas vaginalis G3]
MDDDVKTLISYVAEKYTDLYDASYHIYRLASYYGAVNCFKFLQTEAHPKYPFENPIPWQCLQRSFIGGNPHIISECLKYQETDYLCMTWAIASHNLKISYVQIMWN